jgi:Zn-dependent protease with chaperone function
MSDLRFLQFRFCKAEFDNGKLLAEGFCKFPIPDSRFPISESFPKRDNYDPIIGWGFFLNQHFPLYLKQMSCPVSKSFACLLFSCFAGLLTATAQTAEYQFQKDDPALKTKYYEASVSHTNASLNKLSKDQRKGIEPIYKERLEEVKDLLLSERTVTDKTVNNYLQEIVNKLLSASRINLKPRVVFSRDGWPNAYSMGEGTIAFNAGLFIHLDNEAEVAFVICHEIAHDYFEHGNKAILDHVTKMNDPEFQKELKKISKEKYRVNEKLGNLARFMAFDSRRHSRMHEKEADSMALEIFSSSGYDLDAAITTLEKLDRIDEVSALKPLVPDNILSFPGFPFKSEWIEKEKGLFSAMNKSYSAEELAEMDSLKTHPDCEKRIAWLKHQLVIKSQKGIPFLVNQLYFQKLKTDFLMEITEQSFTEGDLGRHLYMALLLLQENKGGLYPAFATIRTFNRIYEKQKDHSLGNAIDAEDENFSEDYNLLLRMLDRLKLDEILSINKELVNRYGSSLKDYPGFREEAVKLKNNLN